MWSKKTESLTVVWHNKRIYWNVCVSRSVTLVLVKERRLVCERCGDELSRHGEVWRAVGTRSQRVEGVVASSPHGALIRHQVRSVLLTEQSTCDIFVTLFVLFPLLSKKMYLSFLCSSYVYKVFFILTLGLLDTPISASALIGLDFSTAGGAAALSRDNMIITGTLVI